MELKSILVDFYHRRIPSLTLSKSPRPSASIGSRCLRSGSCPKLLLTQSENASCSSIRICHLAKKKQDPQLATTAADDVTRAMTIIITECVVPSEEASEVPPIVSKFSRLEIFFLKVVATSCDLMRAHNSSNSSNDSLPLPGPDWSRSTSSIIWRTLYCGILKPQMSSACFNSASSMYPDPSRSIC